jgi:hypothetical protein
MTQRPTSNLSATMTAWAELDHLVPRQISDGFDQSRSRLLTMSRPMVGQVAIAVLLGVLVGSCWGAERPAGVLPRSDSARLRQLGLTSEIPTRVREACGKARRRVTVRVLCPKLIVDVPLFRPGGGLHGPITFAPTYYMLSFNNGDPPGPARHWIVGGGRARAVEKWVLTDVANETKGNPKLVSRRNVDARTVLIHRFPPFPAGGPNGGHWAAFVRVDRHEMVFASLHGKRYVDAAVEMALDLAKEAEAQG